MRKKKTVLKREKNKDKKISKEGEMLIEVIEQKEWYMLNGSKEGDEEDEFTFTLEEWERR